MRTPAQIEASRRNGAKSKGPKTAEGLARSSQNAIKHGLSSSSIVILDGESETAWEEFQVHFIAKFQPRDFVEERLVIQMAVNQWRLERVWSLQTATVDEESATQEEIVSAKYEQWDTALVHACSYNARRDDLKALDQYESRFVRNFDRALKQLNQIREQYPPQVILENEPKDQEEAHGSEDEPGAEILENEPESNTSKEEVSSEVLKAPAKEENTVPSGDVINRPSPVDAPSNEISRLLPAQNPKNADMPGLRLIA